MRRHRLLPQCLRRLRDEQRGATAVEYGLIVALIVLAAIGAIRGVAQVTVGMWNNTQATVEKASR